MAEAPTSPSSVPTVAMSSYLPGTAIEEPLSYEDSNGKLPTQHVGVSGFVWSILRSNWAVHHVKTLALHFCIEGQQSCRDVHESSLVGRLRRGVMTMSLWSIIPSMLYDSERKSWVRWFNKLQIIEKSRAILHNWNSQALLDDINQWSCSRHSTKNKCYLSPLESINHTFRIANENIHVT